MGKIFYKRFALLTFIIITGCSTSAIFNQKAYELDVNIKVDALSLMDKADENYINYSGEADKLKINIEKAYQYAKGLPGNDETISQWEIIKNPEENSIISFLNMWKAKDKLNRSFIENAKNEISKQFDQVIELESGKRK